MIHAEFRRQIQFKKTKRYDSTDYLEFIRSLSCCVCLSPYPDPHHADTGGMAMKSSDTRSIPLCRKCHTEHDAKGRETFQEEHNVCFKAIQIQCLELYIFSLTGEKF